jgi:hypothetical protein
MASGAERGLTMEPSSFVTGQHNRVGIFGDYIADGGIFRVHPQH